MNDDTALGLGPANLLEPPRVDELRLCMDKAIEKIGFQRMTARLRDRRKDTRVMRQGSAWEGEAAV